MAERTLDQRFWSKVDKRGPDECWLWLGATSQGYGQISVGGKLKRVHRLSFQFAHGPLADDAILDHLCRNRACVNPAHLEPVTERENILRGTSASAVNARKTHCKRGHEFTPDNTYLSPKGRECRTCRRLARPGVSS